MTCDVDNEGRCSSHPFVQLKRKGRSGEWKALLDSCPLCLMDDSNRSGQSTSSASSALVPLSSENNTNNSNWELPLPPKSPMRDSKVKFVTEMEGRQVRKDLQFTLPSSNTYVVASSSESLPGHAHDYDQDYDDVMTTIIPHQHPPTIHSPPCDPLSHTPVTCSREHAASSPQPVPTLLIPSDPLLNRESEDESAVLPSTADGDKDDMKEETKKLPLPPKLPKPQPPPARKQRSTSRHRESKSGNSSTDRKRSSSKSSSKRSTITVQRRSSTDTNETPLSSRPDPEEFPCNVSAGSNHHHIHQHQGSPPPPPPPSQQTLVRQNSPRPYTNVVVNHNREDDEVSAISFMGSVQTCPVPPHYGHHHLHNCSSSRHSQQCEPIDEDNHSTNNEQDSNQPEDPLYQINTNNYDSKGRCVDHPHIRLRKKKMLGRGWKVLMSACPDCCVEELRRIKLVESDRKKQGSRREKKKSSSKHRRRGSSSRGTSMPPPLPSKALKESDDTASLSGSSGGSNDPSRRTTIQMDQVVPIVKKSNQDGIYVRCMQWTDDKGDKGSYTGEVDSRFIPNGMGSMEYEDGTVKKGDWKNGGCRRNASFSATSPRRDRSSTSGMPRSRSCSVGARNVSTQIVEC
ncbi:predicted protein [Thalassiosira pseudonana CCMP1335]|uniref:Uncharacterized protein n=1 Tax=Thalassiosira pseudonana TaxID=35128 RepID=B8BZ61_THAPS|nr:predicted protein [Thalassiosira pseudonana CCMP1335]EED93292.1 predicted protein [Thalassiosira pseudonana CCMP1335]